MAIRIDRVVVLLVRQSFDGPHFLNSGQARINAEVGKGGVRTAISEARQMAWLARVGRSSFTGSRALPLRGRRRGRRGAEVARCLAPTI